MPLIEIPPQGKDVSMTVHLPEETANDVKLYARFPQGYASISAIGNHHRMHPQNLETGFGVSNLEV